MRFCTFWWLENFSQHLLTKSLKLWILPKIGVKKTTIFTREIKDRGIFEKKGLGRWYGLQNTFRGCTFIQSNSHIHIIHGRRKIDFWKFEIFGILGHFLLYFSLKSASKRYFCMFRAKLNTKITCPWIN